MDCRMSLEPAAELVSETSSKPLVIFELPLKTGREMLEDVQNQRDRNQITVSPLRASCEQLKGLPEAMIINGEAYFLNKFSPTTVQTHNNRV